MPTETVITIARAIRARKPGYGAGTIITGAWLRDLNELGDLLVKYGVMAPDEREDFDAIAGN